MYIIYEDDLFCEPEPDPLIIEIDSIKIFKRDLDRLHKKGAESWLNDSIVDGYLNLISRHNKYVFNFSSFFYSSLRRNYSKKKLGKINLFKFHFLLFPILLNSHWRIVIYDNSKKQILLYDSLENSRNDFSNHDILNNILIFLESSYYETFKTTPPFLRELRGIIVQNIPSQSNTNDCGVFMLIFAELVATYRKVEFKEESIPYFKEKIYRSIIKGELEF